jgi:hypothetical protein
MQRAKMTQTLSNQHPAAMQYIVIVVGRVDK